MKEDDGTFTLTGEQQKVQDAVRYIEQKRIANPEHKTLCVVASAGTGKTTTILKVNKSLLEPANRPQGQRLPRICHIAFNVATKLDAETKYFDADVDRYIDTRTINSWGFVFLSRTKYKNRPADGKGGMKFNSEFEIKQSWRELATFLGIRFEAGMPRIAAEIRASQKACYAWKTVKKFCYSKSDKIETWHIARPRKNCPESMAHLHDVKDEEWLRYANALYRASVDLNDKRLSFCQTTMMKEVHLHLKANPDLVPNFMLDRYESVFEDKCVNPTVDYYMVDESQDMDACSFDIISMAACRAKAVLIWIGDPRQSIYQFKGAKNCLGRAVQNVPEAEREKRVFYLTHCHRFGPIIATAVHEFTTAVMEPSEKADFEYREAKYGFSGGMVYQPPLIGVSKFEGIIHDSKSPCLAYPYAVLCRTNKGVILGALRAIGRMYVYEGAEPSESPTQVKEGVKLFWLGEKNSLNSLVTIVEKLIKLADKGVPYMYNNRVKILKFDDLVQKAEEEEDHEMIFYCEFVQKLLADMWEIIQTLRDSKVQEQCQADVVLGTTHQAKGLEFERVQMGDDFPEFIGPPEEDRSSQGPEALPFVTASSLLGEMGEDCDGEEVQMVVKKLSDMERNCVFVCMTRATKELRTCPQYDRLTGWLKARRLALEFQREFNKFTPADEEILRNLDLEQFEQYASSAAKRKRTSTSP